MAKYPTMGVDELMRLPVKEIADRDAVLFLWITVPLLPEGLALLSAWGFRYKTMLTWRKVMSQGMGFWFRGQCEHLLLGVKGKVKAFHLQRSNFYQGRVGWHSGKPDHFRQLIVEAAKVSFERPVMVELFARAAPGLFPGYGLEGWDVFGNEIDGSIKL